MRRIISVSRRTDIPAFYGDWFMTRLKEGFAGVVSPYGGRKYIVSVRPEDVVCFVLWSKDFTPFLENLKTMETLGYRFYFNYTVTGLPPIFESEVNRRRATETLRLLGKTYSPAHINWRFDPVIICTGCDGDYYLSEFEKLACEFEGLVERCYFSFVALYNKVKRNLHEMERDTRLTVVDPGERFKTDLANRLAEVAQRHGMTLYSCCGDYLVNDRIQKAHCIDGVVIQRLFSPDGFYYADKPTRPQCGCTESIDIGTYDTCPHGCVYCYANANRAIARQAHVVHEPDSAFLGFTKSQSDMWLAEIRNPDVSNDTCQLELF